MGTGHRLTTYYYKAKLAFMINNADKLNKPKNVYPPIRLCNNKNGWNGVV